MARFVKRSENEPLMRLERPTLASSQTTAHVINSCFNEVLSQRQKMDCGAINNMAVSRRGDPSVYHHSFVDEAKQVTDEYQSRLEDLLNVERHLLQAKAKALAEDERRLSSQSSTLPPNQDVVLPSGPSQFRKLLSEELLSRHHLLSPSEYLPQPLAPRDAPREGPPAYLQSTYTWTQHALVSGGLDKQQNSFQSRKKKQSLKPVWREGLSQEEREAEKSRLIKLERKAGYLKNPKYSQSVLNNTASSGPLKLKLQQQQQQEVEGTGKEDFKIFVAEPSELVFTEYQVNQTYEATVVLKNVSGASRQLRIIPLNSPFFKVQAGYFPGSEGLIAPGMYCSYVVTFTPDSLANYQEKLMIQCNNGDIITVPLIAFRPPPDLSLPQVLHCGHCLAGHTRTVVMKCDNFGGEGNFKLFPLNPSVQENEEHLPDSLCLGPFSLSPTKFYLSKGGSVELTAVFSPPSVGLYSEQFTMACDNGQTLTFTLKGGADLISIGPVYTGHSSPQEIKRYHSYANSNGILYEEDPTNLFNTSSEDEEDTSEVQRWPDTLECAPTYPLKPAYSTMTVHNYSNVDLPFCWQFYRPVGVPLDSSEDVPVVKQLVPTSNRLFTVQPSSGTLRARESKDFIFEFFPQKVGEFIDVAHFVLSSIDTDLSLEPSGVGRGWVRLTDDQVSIGRVELNGTCEPYSIDLEPSAIALTEEIPSGLKVTKSFKMTNKSLSEFSYQWSNYHTDCLSVSVEPASGQLNPDDSVCSEVVIESSKAGPFSATLHCLLGQSDEPLSVLQVEGSVKAPVVKVSVVNLDFGLIQLGRSSTFKFDIINESHCHVSFQLNQVVKDKKVFIDHQCLSFLPANEGTLEPLSTVTVTVECQPHETGRLRSILQLLVNNEPSRFIPVIAEIQRPKLTLETSQFDIDKAFVDVENYVSTELVNTGLLPAYYSWSSQVIGDEGSHCSVDIHPMTGRVDPGQSETISVKATWHQIGSYQVQLKCDIINVESPLFLSLDTQVCGLSVEYKLIGSATSTPIPEVSTVSPDGELVLDYGSNNKLGEPVHLTLEISNPTAIPTSYEARVSNFPAAKPPTPPEQPMPQKYSSLLSSRRSRGKYLLTRTSNTADPKSKSQQQAALDYSSSLLCEGRGACFVVSPGSGSLAPFSTARVELTAYSDMWGKYSDQLICKVAGLETRVFPINYEVKGCPIVFQTTATSGYTLCRLGSHLPDANTVVRVLRLKNTSPIALRVDWKMMNIAQEDDKIVDLISFIDDPFPKTSFLMDSSSETLQPDHLSTSSCVEASTEVLGDEAISVEDTSHLNELVEGEPLIRALIKPHEGISSNEPFDVHPRQITIPPHGHGAVQVSFQPSIKVLNELGDQLASYALGYISLDDESPKNVTRLSGYDVEPLRIDILAAVEHLKLTLECDEDSGLDFNCVASLLLDDNKQVKEKAILSHHMTLVNHGMSTASIKLSVDEGHFCISNQPSSIGEGSEFITLQPSQSTHFTLEFWFSREDVRQRELNALSSTVHISGSLCVEFSTGARQVFPIAAAISLPGLSVSPQQLDFGTCHLGRSVPLSLLLLNNNPVAALWTMEVLDQELKDVLSLSDESGFLPAQLVEGGPTSQLLQVSFTPSGEKDYTGTVTIKDRITGGVLCIDMCGKGSADEKHLTML